MRTKLTLRYMLMVIISTVLLFVSAFGVLTYIEETTETSWEGPGSFTYNVGDELILINNEEVILSEKGMERLIEADAWLQVLDREGYVIDTFNPKPRLATHYSPFEIEVFGASESFRADYHYNVGITGEEIIYLVGLPSKDWFTYPFELSRSMIRQFSEIMLTITVFILLFMGFVFSRRIAKPVAQMIKGIEGLSNADYESTYLEKGLYKPVFKQMNQLADRLQSNEIERQKTKELREKWISNISHDLKTPLSTIKGYSEILANEEYDVSNEEVRQYSKSIYEKSIYMEEMVEDLRMNEQLMQGEMKIKKESINLISFVRDIVTGILKQPKYANRVIRFNAEEDEIPVLLSKDLMRRALENLTYNALLHNDGDTTITITVKRLDGHLLITVVDDGRGMSEEDQEQLFNRYYRGLNTMNYKGTGLGMSIAKEVIEAHDGELKVNSVLGEGTQIMILL